MIGSLLNIFKIPDLKRRVLITLALFLVYRIGAHVPTPFIDPAKMQEYFKNLSGAGGQGLFAVVDMFSGGAFSQMTIFALGIMPYISASIVLQLLTVLWPRLERIAKEGEGGRKKINQWTRYGTIILALFQGVGIAIFLRSSDLSMLRGGWFQSFIFILTTALTMAAGTCFVMWLGEKITEHGIGNGISLIIAIGIVARYPMDVSAGYAQAASQSMSWLAFIGVLLLMAAVAAFIVFTQEANRKIPIQHARRMVGRRMSTGQSTYLPLKLNMAGVIPVIFSSAILSFPQFVQIPGLQLFIQDWLTEFSNRNLYNLLGMEAGGVFNLLKIVNFYTIAYVVLTAFFCYFYTAITFNPVDLADNLKKSGAFIPGKKPGKPTSDYLNHILVRITVAGALTLIVVALIPHMLVACFNIPYAFASMAGGTGLIIVVGVFLDTMKQIESQLLMRHYEGFKYKGASGSARRTRR